MIGKLSNLSSRQKDEFIKNLLKISESVLGEDGFSRTASSPVVPTSAMIEKAEKAFNAIFTGPNGLKRVAFAMQVPLKSRLDYVAVGRNRVLLVDEIPQGEFPIYDLDIPEFGAVVVAARGEAPRFQANIKRVQFPTFPISIDHELKWEEIQIRRYPAFDRGKERVAIAMAIAEDDEIVKVMEAAVVNGPNTPFTASSVTRYALADAYKQILANQLIVGGVMMNPEQYADILKWNSTDLDQVSLNTIVETGLFGSIYGARMLVTTRCPAKTVYVFTTPDKLGRIPERKAVEVKIFDNIPKNQYDIVGWEQIGIGIHNTAGITKFTIV